MLKIKSGKLDCICIGLFQCQGTGGICFDICLCQSVHVPVRHRGVNRK